ncbi:FG-GAP repeat domain-containing protein [Pseudopedobacter beijingensis]|uniref:FG-GAP repeat domain-containing protein n=1 Tax=Pseudopedobacter beijingensis TaxID=1207056 RepID=A0ABW4IH25_9SPHI
MNLNRHLLFLIATLFSLSLHAQHETALKSGEPILNGNPNGIGRLSPAFYNGYIMGIIDIPGKGKNNLFLQGTDGHGRGTYWYPFRKLSPEGIPVYKKPIQLTLPFEDKGNNRGVVINGNNNEIIFVWGFGKTLKWAYFNLQTLTFSALKTIKIEGLPRGFSEFGVSQQKNGKYTLFFSIREEGVFGSGRPFPQKITYTPEGFWPYDIARLGIYGATIDDLEVTQASAKQLTPTDQVYYAFDGFTVYREGAKSTLLAGTRLGNIAAYTLNESNLELGPKKFATGTDGIILRNPNVHAYVAYFNDSVENQGVVTIGEGGIYYYRNTRKFDKKGNLILEKPQHLLQEEPNLYGGSLVVPCVVDWDGDGKLDIISGTSPGYIYFFKNIGTNQQPQYIDPVPLKAADEIIQVQPGYKEDIQGPGEARWGYTCPTVIDWDGDGLPDILTGDSRGKFMVYLNKGTKTNPVLEREHTLYLNGMDMFGTWRVKPGVSKIGDKMAYITTDKDDEFHLYWQLDKYNLTDGGKLKIGDTLAIRGNRYGGGTVGRSKIEIVDWDEDGKKDLLIGTYGKQSIPDTVSGLPLNMKPKRGSTVLFMKNIGTDEKPVYQYPRVLKFKGKNISLGGHSCAPSTARIGEGGRLNLVVGIETGIFMFYDRKDLSW